MLILPAWGNAWLEFRLEPSTGKWRIGRLQEAHATESPAGLASLEPLWGVWRRFYAIYVHEGRLYFQCGKRKWDVTGGVTTCKFWAAGYGFMSGLILKFKNGETLRPVLIHPLRWLGGRIDPTYDGIDAEADHFFLFIRQQLPDAKWRQAFIDRQGKSHASAY